MKKPFNAELHVELWKHTVDVQQHFNDIGWRIRAIALTALTFTFAATGLTFANTARVPIGPFHVSPAVFVPLLGLLLWWAFWFMDAKWFHRLLIGSVRDGARLEQLLKDNGIEADLGSAINAESGVKVVPWGKPLRSKERLDVFYRTVGAALIIIAGIIAFLDDPPARVPQPIEITVILPTATPTLAPLPAPTPTP